MRSIISAAIVASTLVAMPAAAVTTLFSFGGSAGNFNSVAVTPAGGPTVTVTAKLYTGLPSALSNVSQLTGSPQVNRTAQAIGVNGGANAQLDTNSANAREAFILSSTAPLKISELKFSWVDENDSLRIFGINPDGSLTTLIFGEIDTGLGGLATVDLPNGNGNADRNTAALGLFTPLAAFDRFVFTTDRPGNPMGQGYRLVSLSAGVVPEPTTWAMLIAGFGLVGFAARRRRVSATA